jgi:AcrR family transcriptional regulator
MAASSITRSVPARSRPGEPAAARAELAKGHAAAPVRAVARRAGVGPALVYHYFSGKAGLFVACFELPADPRAIQRQAGGASLDGTRIVEAFLAQREPEGQAPGTSFVTLTQAVSSAHEAARALQVAALVASQTRTPRCSAAAVPRSAAGRPSRAANAPPRRSTRPATRANLRRCRRPRHHGHRPELRHRARLVPVGDPALQPPPGCRTQLNDGGSGTGG